MSLIAAATRFVERAPLPDALSKLGVAALVDRASRSLSTRPGRAASRPVRACERRGMGRQSLPLAPDLTRLGAFARDIWRWVAAYAANPDPRVASCNTIALLVASNQPFYPLYVYFSVSPHIAPTLLTFLSTPFFLAIPAISRRSPVLGRALLPLTGLANVVVSAKAFGAASGRGDVHSPLRTDRGGLFPSV